MQAKHNTDKASSTHTSNQSDLRNMFNPDGSTLRKMQLRMLRMLEWFDAFCHQHNLCYWLANGTCLGTVRHSGFIPWDDDIDVAMPAEDLSKFICLINDCISADTRPYMIHWKGNDPEYILPFAKLLDPHSRLISAETDLMHSRYRYQGISIDIFPMVEVKSLWPVKTGHMLYAASWRLATANAGWIRKIGTLTSRIAEKTIPRLQRLADGAISEKTTWICHAAPAMYTHRFHRNDIFPLRRMFFEGRSFPVPNDTDSYLRSIYADYERIPDICEIHIHSRDVTFSDE